MTDELPEFIDTQPEKPLDFACVIKCTDEISAPRLSKKFKETYPIFAIEADIKGNDLIMNVDSEAGQKTLVRVAKDFGLDAKPL